MNNKNHIRSIALLLFGFLLVVASDMAQKILGYPADRLMWFAGIIVGIWGLVLAFAKEK